MFTRIFMMVAAMAALASGMNAENLRPWNISRPLRNLLSNIHFFFFLRYSFPSHA
jgi:hypothetical protein